MNQLTPLSEIDTSRVPRACQSCASAKVRCDFETGREICKRCHRLRKVCTGQKPGAHRRKKPKTIETPRGGEKLYGAICKTPTSQHSLSSPLGNSCPNPADFAPVHWVGHFIQNDCEGETLLQTFRLDFSSLFPFVVVPRSKPFIELRKEKPYLVLALSMIAFQHDQVRQNAIAKKMREIIGYNLLVKGEQNLDLLQGLLIYLGWYHLHLHLGSQVCNLVHLVMAMMIDLGLNRGGAPRNLKPAFGSAGYFDKLGPVPAEVSLSSKGASNSGTARSLEERRTYLGCYFVTSIISMCTRDIEPIRYSKYIDECCQNLSEMAEYPTDISAVHLTRLQGVADKIFRTLSPEEWLMPSGFASAPIGACVKMLESELVQLKATSPQEAKSGILLMHHYSIELFLYEVALSDNVESERYGVHPFGRLNMLYACLNSMRHCFDTAYAFTPLEWFDLPYTSWALLGHAIVILSRLSLCKVEGWEQDSSRGLVDFSRTMDKLAQKLEEARASLERDSEYCGNRPLLGVAPRLFSALPAKLQQVKMAHEAKYATQTAKPYQAQKISSSGPASTPIDEELSATSMTAFFEFLDDDFWQQFT